MTTPLLFDTDPGNDDAVALAIALASDEIDVVGVTAVAGNTTLDNATRNALSILELLGRTDVPVAAGAAGPLYRDLEVAEGVHGEGGIYGDPPAPTADAVEQTAVETILDAVRTYGEDLVIAAVGPQTNLAAAMAAMPDLPERVGDIYVMGGAALVPGNTTPTAEFNVYVDPEAANRVVRDGEPHVVGLDATHDATVPAEYVEELAERPDPHRTLAAWLGYSPVESIRDGALEGGQIVHDATVIVDVLAEVLEYRELPLDVETGEGICRGETVADLEGRTGEPANAKVATGVDLETYRERLYELVEAVGDLR